MRFFESASLLLLAVALFALAFRAGLTQIRRVLFGAAVGMMGLQALVEGARWQLAPAHVVAAIGGALVLRRSAGTRARSKVFGVARVVLAVIALFVAVFLPIIQPVPRFPSPDGPHPVGTVTFMLQDPAREDAGQPGRPRRLMAQAWYPVDPSAASSPRARYMPDVIHTGPALARMAGLPPLFANHLVYASSHSHWNALFAASLGSAPVLILSHGFRFIHSASTTTAEALASQGYVVIALEHTDDAAAVAFPDGTVALTRARVPADATDEEEANIKASWVLVRVADVRFVLDTLVGAGAGAGAVGGQIPDVLNGPIDTARVGVFGHSLGGATAAEACRTDARIVACADIDGNIYGEAQTAGVAQPFLLVQTDTRVELTNAFVGRLRGPSCRLDVADAMHMDFTDIPTFSPLLPYLVPGMGKSEDSAAVLGETNRAVTAFFDATLRGDAAGWSRVRSAHPRFSSTCERLPGR